MKLGSYSIDVSTSGMPQKVATGFSKVFEGFVGADYQPIAYLGSKLVNGTNHAILCEQTLVTGKDVKSIVLVVLNEKPGDIDGTAFSIVGIDNLLSNGGALGGFNIAPTTTIPDEAKAVFDKAFQGFLGSNVKPFALLATKIVHGVEYAFAAELSMVIKSGTFTTGNKSIAIVKVFSDYSEVSIDTIIEGYGKAENGKALGAPLGEWP